MHHFLRSVCPLIHRSTRAFCRSSKPLPPASLANQSPSPPTSLTALLLRRTRRSRGPCFVWPQCNTLIRKPTWIITARMTTTSPQTATLLRIGSAFLLTHEAWGEAWGSLRHAKITRSCVKHMIRNELLHELTACADCIILRTRIFALDDSSSEQPVASKCMPARRQDKAL